MAALLLSFPATKLDAQEAFIRFDHVACELEHSEVNGGFGPCFVDMDEFCEKPKAGSYMECLNHSIQRVADYVLANRGLLPRRLETGGVFSKRAYLNMKKRLAAFVPNNGVCTVSLVDPRLIAASEKHNETVEELATTLCVGINNSVGLSDLLAGARLAGIELPDSD